MTAHLGLDRGLPRNWAEAITPSSAQAKEEERTQSAIDGNADAPEDRRIEGATEIGAGLRNRRRRSGFLLRSRCELQIGTERDDGGDAQGWRTDLHDCGIPAADAPKLLALALRNFNANHDRQLDRHREAMLAAIRKTIAPQ